MVGVDKGKVAHAPSNHAATLERTSGRGSEPVPAAAAEVRCCSDSDGCLL